MDRRQKSESDEIVEGKERGRVQGKNRTTSVRNGGMEGYKDWCNKKGRKDRSKKEWKKGRQTSK